MASIFWLLLVAAAAYQDSVNKETLAQVMQAAASQFDDFSCEYEGTMSFPNQPGIQEEPLLEKFDGYFLFRSRDSACLMDVYHRQAKEGRLLRETIVTLQGRTESYGRPEDQPNGRGRQKAASRTDYYRIGSLGKIYSTNYILGMLRSERYELSDKGSARVNDWDARAFEIAPPTSGGARAGRLLTKFWMNLEHGFPLRVEEYVAGSLRSRTDIKEIRRFDVGGAIVWLPVLGVYEAFGTFDQEKKYVHTKYPTNRESTALLWKTVKFNTHPDDKVFSVAYRDGDLITDHIKKVKFEYNHQKKVPDAPPVTRAQAEQQLKACLAEADAQGDELRASSAEQASQQWTVIGLLPWMVAVTSTAALAIVLVRRHGPR